MKKGFLASIALLTLAACTKPTAVENDAHALRDKVVQAQNDLNAVDSTQMESAFEKLNTHLNWIKDMPFDSTKKEFYTYNVTWLERTQANLRKFRKQVPDMKVELNKSISQMDALINDIHNNLLDTADARLYLQQEEQSIYHVLRVAKERADNAAWSISRTDSIAAWFDQKKLEYNQ